MKGLNLGFQWVLIEKTGFKFYNENLYYLFGLLAQDSEEEFKSLKSDNFVIKCDIIPRGN